LIIFTMKKVPWFWVSPVWSNPGLRWFKNIERNCNFQGRSYPQCSFLWYGFVSKRGYVYVVPPISFSLSSFPPKQNPSNI
jgi:hypothetical protein